MGIGPQGENLIFIFSQPRAGTTLLQRILGSHPDVYTMSEPWFMLPVLEGLVLRWTSPEGREMTFARSNTNNFLYSIPHGHRTYFDQLRILYVNLCNAALQPSGKKIFLLKEPRHSYFIPELSYLFPSAKFIFLFRNPLAVLCSVINTWTRQDRELLMKDHYDDLFVAPSLLLEGRERLRDRSLLCRFEDLVENPSEVISSLCGPLNIPFVPSMLEYNRSGLPRWPFGDQKTYRYDKPVASKADAWKQDLAQPFVWNLAQYYLNHVPSLVFSKMGYPYDDLKKLVAQVKPSVWKRIWFTIKEVNFLKTLNRSVKSYWKLRLERMRRRCNYFSYTSKIFEPLFWIMGFRKRKRDGNLKDLKRILVVRLDNIGDMVLMTPFLRELRLMFPHGTITLVVKPGVFNLVELCPYVDSVISYDIERPLPKEPKHYQWTWKQVGFARGNFWKKRFQLAILPRWDVDYSYACFLAYFSGAQERIAYSSSVRELKKTLNFRQDEWLTRPLKTEDTSHEVRRNLDLLSSVGSQCQDDSLEIWLDKHDENFAEDMLSAHHLTSVGPVICYAMGSRQLSKRWPIKNFVQLGSWLMREHGALIMAMGHKDETGLGKILAEQLDSDSFVDMTGKTTLRQAAAIMKRCDAYIGNDTGLKHIEAVFHKPVLEISSWPQGDKGDRSSDYSPERFSPWKTDYCLVSPEKCMLPCEGACTSKDAHCISQVSVEQVKKGFEELYFKKHMMRASA